MKKIKLAALLTGLVLLTNAHAQSAFEPSGTYLFAARDTCDLYLDVYDPAPGSETTFQGRAKPTVLFAFGGGFKNGTRDNPSYLPWFKALCDNGYRVVSIDYRLGMKGYKGRAGVNKEFVAVMENSINIAVEDMLSATAFLAHNAGELGIDPAGIVACGSSAGAIACLQAEWEINNGTETAAVLPEGFDYAGVMPFSGAVYNRKWGVHFIKEPCPIALFHGTDDNIVPYGSIRFFSLFFGGAKPVSKFLTRKGYRHHIYRFEDHGHEIATTMMHNLELELDFLEQDVILGRRRMVDTTIVDTTIPVPEWGKAGTASLYD